METLGDRLERLLISLKTNQLQFCKAAGINQPYFSSILNGKKDISRGILEKILLAYPDINTNWLFTGNGRMFLPVADHISGFMEERPEYGSTPTKIHPIADELTLKGIVSENLKTAAARWDLFNHELFALLDPEAGRQAISKYMLGQSIPGLPALVRLEYITSIPLAELITRKISAEELPPAPIEPGNVLPALLATLRRSEATIQQLIAK